MSWGLGMFRRWWHRRLLPRCRRQASAHRPRRVRGLRPCVWSGAAGAPYVAKVTRDALMREEAEHYPAYDFESNVGYPAAIHKSALAWYGPSAIHRRSWIFMDGLCWRGVPPAPGRLF